MTAVRIARACLAGTSALMLAAQPVSAAPKLKIPGGGGGGGYSVSGKKGPFIKQIAERKFEQTGGAGSAGLSDDAINRGEFQAARLRMPETERRVAEMLARIEARWPYSKAMPLKVQILGLKHYSAQSLPDGSVVVAFGLIDRAESDDEVAFVLAHELGHIRLGHFAKQAQLQRRRQNMNKLAQLYVTAQAVRGGVESRSLNFDNSAAAKAGRQAAATTDLIRFATEVMIAPAWSRDQEDEADALGFDLSEAAPYAAETASARVFDTIQADADNRAAMSATLQAKMADELKTAAVNGGAERILTGGISGESMKKGLLKGAGRIALAVAANTEGGPKHRTPEARKKGMADYTNDAYPEGLPLREEDSAWLKQVRASREYQQARIAVQAVQGSLEARAGGDYARAQSEIAKAQTTSFRTAPLILNEAARLADDMGQTARADQLFIQAHQSQDQTVDGYTDHVRMLFRTGQYDRAEQVVAQGVQRFGNDDKPFLSLRVAISYKQGRKEDGQRYLKRCMDYGDEGLGRDCSLAAGESGGAGDAEAAKAKKPVLPKFNLTSLSSLPIPH
ncbi:MAG: M48 family metalloprotease [Caulobacteraceae bacterium]